MNITICSIGGAFGIVGIVLASIVLLLFLVSFLVFKRLFSRPKSVYKPNAITYKMMGKDLDKLNAFIAENLAELIKLPNELITVKSSDGLTLSGYYYPCGKPTDRAVLLSHGFNSTCYNTYSAQALFYLSEGFDVYLLNHRAHEKSEGAYSSFSIKEGADILPWLQLMVSRNPNYKIMIHGNSMGAAAVMEATALDLPENVKCAISDCGFSSATEELLYQMKNMFHLPGFLSKIILSIIGIYCKLIAHFDLKSVSALESLKQAKIPVMFVHGTADATVPYAMGQANYDACRTAKKIVLYDNTGHGASFFKNTEAMKGEILSWADEYVK